MPRTNAERQIGRKYCTPEMTIEERLSHVGWTVTDRGCWEWNGGKHTGGYGVLSFQGRTLYVHRIALETRLGRPLDPGMFACHKCDNPPCMNPDHLFEGTHRENNWDAKRKGRLSGGRQGGSVRYPLESFQTAFRMRGQPLAVISAASGLSPQYISMLFNGSMSVPAVYAHHFKGN